MEMESRESSSGNFVFSPFSLHSAITMLASGATDESKTANQLLLTLGRTQNIQQLKAQYKRLLNEYKVT